MDMESAPFRETVSGLDQILDLEETGVKVARGKGTGLQKTAVIALLVYGLFAVLTLVKSNIWILLVLPVVILAIDFLSGFVHWFFDTQVQPSSTFLGRIAIDFLDHHIRPRRTVDVGFFMSAWRPAVMVSLPFLTFALLLKGNPLASAVALWIGCLSMLVPQTHKLAHHPVPGRLAATFQSARLMIQPGSHQKHHADNKQSFCVFTGWFNPILDKSGFWRRMERFFATMRGKPC